MEKQEKAVNWKEIVSSAVSVPCGSDWTGRADWPGGMEMSPWRWRFSRCCCCWSCCIWRSCCWKTSCWAANCCCCCCYKNTQTDTQMQPRVNSAKDGAKHGRVNSTRSSILSLLLNNNGICRKKCIWFLVFKRSFIFIRSHWVIRELDKMLWAHLASGKGQEKAGNSCSETRGGKITLHDRW